MDFLLDFLVKKKVAYFIQRQQQQKKRGGDNWDSYQINFSNILETGETKTGKHENFCRERCRAFYDSIKMDTKDLWMKKRP